MTLHRGIDIGIQGAVAIIDQAGALVEIHDMPVLKDGPAGRRAINAPLLAALIFKSHADHAFVEWVGARPGQGAVGAFAFGRAEIQSGPIATRSRSLRQARLWRSLERLSKQSAMTECASASWASARRRMKFTSEPATRHRQQLAW